MTSGYYVIFENLTFDDLWWPLGSFYKILRLWVSQWNGFYKLSISGTFSFRSEIFVISGRWISSITSGEERIRPQILDKIESMLQATRRPIFTLGSIPIWTIS